MPEEKHGRSSESEVTRELENLRERIDAIDNTLITLLAERQEEVRRVVSLKKKHNVPVYHPAREENLISERRRRAQEMDLSPQFIEDIFRILSQLKQENVSAIIVEQNLSVVTRLADRVYVMKEGKIIKEIADTGELADTAELESYL